jgi:hypothetical protein
VDGTLEEIQRVIAGRDIPVAYVSHIYGETQISLVRHGVLLPRTVIFVFRKLKAF